MTCNILVTSISKKTPLLNALKNALHTLNIQGTIFGADINPACIGRYFVDEFWHIPLQANLTIETLLSFCRHNRIKLLIPTRDGELPFFAQHQATLQAHGIWCAISPASTIEICRDKWQFSQFLKQHHHPGIPTALNAQEINAQSFVVKHRCTSGSLNLKLNINQQEAIQWATTLEQPIFQPYIAGDEYSVDLYVDRSGAVKGSIVRKRDLVMEGESQITTSLKNPKMEQLCQQVVKDLKIYGPAVIQLISDNHQQLHLIECNPRFGGASTLSLAMGLHTFEWLLLEALGRPLPPFCREMQEKRQIRYAQDLILPSGAIKSVD